MGPGVARNLAAASARGTWLVFIDADVLVHPDAIRRLLEPLRTAGPHAAIAATIDGYQSRVLARPDGALVQSKLGKRLEEEEAAA